jgi:uncharacterized membrane protein (UPF0127 family)
MANAALYNKTTQSALAARVVRCDTFWKRGLGLMFHRPLPKEEVYLFVLDRPSVLDATIHMFFVSFPIAVVWLDEAKRVIHRVLAQPWRPYYAPPKPARYFLEGHPDLLVQVDIGDEVEF